MKGKYLIDINYLSNGSGKMAYGGRIDAYSFQNLAIEQWYEQFKQQFIESIGKNYLPVYRIGDGELRFLFGSQINWKAHTVRSIVRYVKNEILFQNWRTSWGETYNRNQKKELKQTLINCIVSIAKFGKLSIYWNENGLNAFIEYNRNMEKLFRGIHIELNSENYVPFHFGQALVAKDSESLFKNRNVLIVSGIPDDEISDLREVCIQLKIKNFEFYRCSSTSALAEDYSNIKLKVNPDIVLVAAGIGAAKVLFGLKHLNCPILDIGSYIHVLSGKKVNAHAGFFIKPS